MYIDCRDKIYLGLQFHTEIKTSKLFSVPDTCPTNRFTINIDLKLLEI